MSLDWLSSPANPAMVEWELIGLDIYGCVAHLNFASMTWRVVLTSDHETWVPVTAASDLADVAFLDKGRPPLSAV
jgi:hypothetical protein